MTKTEETVEAIDKQVQRLKASNQGFALDEEYAVEVGRILLSDFPTIDAAKETVTHFIRTLAKLPTPAEFAQAALSYTGKVKREFCPACDGTGFRPVRMKEATTGDIQFFADVPLGEKIEIPDDSAGVELCSCRAGGGR